MSKRGRQSFAKHSKILQARASLRSRLIAYTSLVRNSVLYVAETWPVSHRLLKAANSLQSHHMRVMLHLGRRPTEAWADWHVRSLRTARLQLQRGGWERWSTYILKRIWSLWGHMARGGQEVNAMVEWKNLSFWRAAAETSQAESGTCRPLQSRARCSTSPRDHRRHSVGSSSTRPAEVAEFDRSVRGKVRHP